MGTFQIWEDYNSGNNRQQVAMLPGKAPKNVTISSRHAEGDTFDAGIQRPGVLSCPEPLGGGVPERPDHWTSITPRVMCWPEPNSGSGGRSARPPACSSRGTAEDIDVTLRW